jgi:hypothetical protein
MISFAGELEELAREAGERLVAQSEQEVRERTGVSRGGCCLYLYGGEPTVLGSELVRKSKREELWAAHSDIEAMGEV